jgi:chromosome segregation ATPase
MVTVDELDSRTRYLEGEVEGEKAVTRHVLTQASLNADDLGTLKTQVRHLTEQMVLVNAALSTHGNRLNVLTQDVTMLRQEVTVLRGEVTALRSEMNRRFDAVERNIALILAAVVPAVSGAT